MVPATFKKYSRRRKSAQKPSEPSTPRKIAREKRKFRERQARKAIRKKLKHLGLRILEQEVLRQVRELITEELIRMAQLKKEMLEETAVRLNIQEDPNELGAEFQGMRIDKH